MGAEARLGQRLGSLESEAGQEDGQKWKEMERVHQFSKPSLGREGRKHRV